MHSPTLLQNIQPPSSSRASTLGMCSLTLLGETLISLVLRIRGYSLVYFFPFLYNIFLPFCTLFISFLCLPDVYK